MSNDEQLPKALNSGVSFIMIVISSTFSGIAAWFNLLSNKLIRENLFNVTAAGNLK